MFDSYVVESKRKTKTKTETRIKQQKVQVQVQMPMVVCHNTGNQREVNTFNTTLVIQLFWIISEPVFKCHIILCLRIYSNIGFLVFSVCLPSGTKRVSALISHAHWKQLKTCLAQCCDIDQIISKFKRLPILRKSLSFVFMFKSLNEQLPKGLEFHRWLLLFLDNSSLLNLKVQVCSKTKLILLKIFGRFLFIQEMTKEPYAPKMRQKIATPSLWTLSTPRMTSNRETKIFKKKA